MELRVALKAGVFRADYYTGHSFRIEAAMTAASSWNARYSDKDIGTMGERCIYVIY